MHAFINMGFSLTTAISSQNFKNITPNIKIRIDMYSKLSNDNDMLMLIR